MKIEIINYVNEIRKDLECLNKLKESVNPF